jgi:hypothetical protein
MHKGKQSLMLRRYEISHKTRTFEKTTSKHEKSP